MEINKSIKSGIVLAFISMFVFVTVMASPVYAETALPEGSAQDETVLSDPAEPEGQAEQTEAEDAIQMEKSASANPEEADATVMTEESAQAEPAEQKTAVRAKVAAQDEGADSNLEQAPLDFTVESPGASGDGWTWDQETKKLTLDGMKLNLTDYSDSFEAAIKLPDGSTVNVVNDSGIALIGTESGEGRVAVYAAGDLTIQGGKLAIDAEQGANGIKADGNIQISGEGSQLEIARATCFGIYAGKKFSADGSTIVINIVDTKGTFRAKNYGTIIVDGTGVAADTPAVDIKDSTINIHNQVDNQEHLSHGIYAVNGSVQIAGSKYIQMGDDACPYTGIRSGNGSVAISSSDVEMQIGTYNGKLAADRSLISAESEGNKITISGSTVKGQGDGKGLNAKGGIEISNCTDKNIDITTTDNAISTDAGLSITGSEVQLISTGNDKDTVNTAGAVTVDASEVYISAKGTGSTGLKTTSTVDISGDSYVDMDGDFAAVQMIASSTASEPITLSDGLAVKVGGTLQHVGGGSETIYSYSNKTLDPDLRNASKNVAIAKDSRMIFTEQPKDAVVDYPGGASFEVSVAGGSEDQYTYQWYAMDIVGKEFKLSGTSAKTRKLDIPSTRQEDNRLIYYCVVTCGQDTLASKEAYLDMSNKTQNQTVLYVGNYAVLPGKSIDLDATNPNIGTGTISLDSDGVNITMDNVKINNEKSEYDVLLSPALCIRLDRSQSRDARTDKVYTVVLKGENEIKNSFSTSSGNGIPLDFMLRGEEKTGQPPTVIIDGETKGGTLSIKGGTIALRAIANLIINADITVEPYSDTDTFLDAIVADVTDVQHPHKLTVGANHKLRIKSLGSGLSASGALSIGENTEVDVDMTMPHIESSGSTLAQKGAVFAGKDKFEMKPNSKLNISCTLDPELMAEGSECLGLLLGGAALKADKSTININMKAKEPKEGKKSYARAMTGIYSKSYIYMTDSDLSVSVEGDKWATDAAGVNAGTNITMDNCKANIKASANSYVYGLVSSGDFGHYTKLNASQIDIATNYVGGNGLNYGIAGSQMNIDVSKEGSYIKVNSTNANGLAFAAKNGEEGDAPKSYDPSYKAKMITGKFTAVQPQSAVVNVASIHTGSGYEDIETFYDSKNTSKPLASVELAVVQPSPVDPTPVGSKHNVAGSTYVVKSADAVSLVKAKSKKSFTLPATVKISGKTFKVTGIQKNAFKGKKVRTLIVKTKKLTKKSVKGSLKGSKVSKVRVKVGKKKTNKKYVKKYKKIFTKKNAGRKVKVTL